MYHRDSLRLFHSKHEENPALYDQRTGAITEQGKRTMSVLDALTGVRKQRLRFGMPAQAEGAVYDEWDESVHRIYADQVPEIRRYIGGQDWGYTNPGVFGAWGVDGDGRMYLLHQIYQTQRTIDWWQEQIKLLQRKLGRFDAVLCDPSEPSHIQSFRNAGINAQPADNARTPGIDAVKRRLAEKRLFVVRDSLQRADDSLVENRKPCRVEDEFPMYVWADKKAKEEPVKEDDHGMDMTRYTVMYLDGNQPSRRIVAW
jgi:phage terminase large subunit